VFDSERGRWDFSVRFHAQSSSGTHPSQYPMGAAAEFETCLLSFSPKSFVFPSHYQKT